MVKHKDVTPPGGGSGFGRSALRCHNKIFAMLVRDQLVHAQKEVGEYAEGTARDLSNRARGLAHEARNTLET